MTPEKQNETLSWQFLATVVGKKLVHCGAGHPLFTKSVFLSAIRWRYTPSNWEVTKEQKELQEKTIYYVRHRYQAGYVVKQDILRERASNIVSLIRNYEEFPYGTPEYWLERGQTHATNFVGQPVPFPSNYLDFVPHLSTDTLVDTIRLMLQVAPVWRETVQFFLQEQLQIPTDLAEHMYLAGRNCLLDDALPHAAYKHPALDMYAVESALLPLRVCLDKQNNEFVIVGDGCKTLRLTDWLWLVEKNPWEEQV